MSSITNLDAEVDRNFDAFQILLPTIVEQHRGEYALLRDREVTGFYASLRDALNAGAQRFADHLFSIQEVTDKPADLGLFSHANNTRLA